VPFADLAPGGQSANFWTHPRITYRIRCQIPSGWINISVFMVTDRDNYLPVSSLNGLILGIGSQWLWVKFNKIYHLHALHQWWSYHSVSEECI